MKDARRKQRKQLFFYLKVFDVGTKELLGNLVDFTMKGVMLISKNKHEVGKTYSLKVELPASIHSENAFIVNAVCRWAQPSPNETFFDGGFEFLQEQTLDEDLINQLIYKIGFKG